MREPNVIYVAEEPVFIHVYPIDSECMLRYHPVDPPATEKEMRLLAFIESRLLDIVEEDLLLKNTSERRKFLRDNLDQILKVGKKDPDHVIERKSRWDFSKLETLEVTEETASKLRYLFEKERVGLGKIEPLMRDPYIEDITCDGVGKIFLYHAIFGPVESDVLFRDESELNSFVIKLSDRVSIPVSHRRPIVDSALPDGSRLNIVFGRDISRKGSNFTIRKFRENPISITQLIKWRTLNAQTAAYMWMLILEGLNFFVIGETACGKTTTLNALTVFIPPSWKIVSIEEAPEIYLPHKNWVQQIVRTTKGSIGDVSMYDLLRAALRQRPDYMVPGEIRGKEGFVVFQSMETGHPVMSTVHADTINRLVQRLVGDPINIPKASIGNVEVVIIQRKIYDKLLNIRRVAISVNEIIGYDSKEDAFRFIPLFYWNSVQDEFTYRGHGNSYLLNTKIAPSRGLAHSDYKVIYDELDKRAKLLQAMVDFGNFGYNAVWNAVQKIEDVGIENISNPTQFIKDFMEENKGGK
jgi:flagellar protein FlaI